MRDLQRIRAEEREVQSQEEASHKPSQRPTPFPLAPRHDKNQQCGNDHGAGHRDPIGGGQIAGGAEEQDQADGADQHQDIDGGEVDLSDLGGRRIPNRHAWQIAQLNRLLCEGKGSAQHRL